MTPGAAAVCPGTVHHRRSMPHVHEFRYPVAYVWLDPDRPDELCGAHRWWSATRPAPARFRRRDYGCSPVGSLADAALDALVPVLDRRPRGPVRMLTQVRRWGWLFNPITVYVVWDHGEDDVRVSADDAAANPADDPVGVVLEVTNTPWKERIRYPLPLEREGGWLTASTAKVLHVSPFLDESQRYDVAVRDRDDSLELRIDVVPDGGSEPVVATGLTVERRPANRTNLAAVLRQPVAPTHRVSLGIHWQALRLWLKRVPVVAHPRKRTAVS